MANRFDYTGGAQDEWLAQVQEPILLPELPIIDAHHHLWMRDKAPYLLREFATDLNSGHNLVGSVFAECHAMYRPTGPEAMRSVGEMEFIAGIAAMSDAGAFETQAVCRAAVGNVDLTLGDAVEPVLAALSSASGGRFRGVRASICWDDSDTLHRAAPFAQYLRHAEVRKGIAALARLGYSLDCWLYHPQIPELIEIADAFPDLAIILNHSGTPILGGPYRDRLDEVAQTWGSHMREIARRDNVYLKLGALPAKFSGENKAQGLPPSSDDVAAAWSPWILPTIEWFGAERCMFESNFPVHKNWVSYPVLWNAFKKIAREAGTDEHTSLFAGTAIRAYRMDLTLS
jgi:predicted TIM-barrel fold metal-dependent hydrolase